MSSRVSGPGWAEMTKIVRDVEEQQERRRGWVRLVFQDNIKDSHGRPVYIYLLLLSGYILYLTLGGIGVNKSGTNSL